MESDDDETFIVVVGDVVEPFSKQVKDVDHLMFEVPVMEFEEDSKFEESIKDEPKIGFPAKGEIEEEHLDLAELSDDCATVPQTKMVLRERTKLKPSEKPTFEDSIKDESEDVDKISIDTQLSPKRDIEEEFSLDDSEQSDDGARAPPTKTALRARTRRLTPAERHSYVQSIQKLHPELRKDEQLLVDSLVAIMRETKPPPPPKDYYILNDIMLQCKECGHLTDTLPAASRHYQEKHGERYLYCLACGVNFRSTTNLYKHEKICESADAVYVLRARDIFLGLRGRERRVPGQPKPKPKPKPEPKKFDCPQCSASFKSKYSLTAHAHMHAGVRPYVCRICYRGYTSSLTLSRHVKKHDEAERYVCAHCQRSFNVKAALAAHLATHQPLKRFACGECEARYAQRASLLLHVNREHRGLPPPCACQMCPKRYPRMSVLKEHMRKVHGMQLMTRNMFFKSLPTLTQRQVRQAKLVMKSELQEDPDYYSIENGNLT